MRRCFWKRIKHFTPEEFDDPSLKGTGKYMDKRFIKLLDKARKKAGIPFIINSGARTLQTNERVGGEENSTHLILFGPKEVKGRKGTPTSMETGVNRHPNGADIHAETSRERFLIVSSLLSVGFTRLGIYDTHVHVDSGSPDHPEKVIW